MKKLIVFFLPFILFSFGDPIADQECINATEDRDILAYPGDCTKFIRCDLHGGEHRVYQCPVPLHFNPDIMTCDFPENANCSDGDYSYVWGGDCWCNGSYEGWFSRCVSGKDTPCVRDSPCYYTDEYGVDVPC